MKNSLSYFNATLLFWYGISLFFYYHNYRILQIKSGSMEPSFPTFCKILVDRSPRSYQRFDSILFRHPLRLEELQVKRIVGLPGEHFEILEGNLYLWKTPSQREILRKPPWWQEQGQYFYGNPLFEPVFYWEKEEKENPLSPWKKQDLWTGWTLPSSWKAFDTKNTKNIKDTKKAFQGKGEITYQLPLRILQERPAGLRSDQKERVLVQERSQGEVRFQLAFETQGHFRGEIQEDQHQLFFEVQDFQVQLRTTSDLFPTQKTPWTPLSPTSSFILEWGNYDHYTYLLINGVRLDLAYLSDPLREKKQRAFRFVFEEECVLYPPQVAIDNFYKKELEGTYEVVLPQKPVPEYFVCGDNTFLGRFLNSSNGVYTDFSLSGDSRLWEKVRVTHADGRIFEYEDRMEELSLYRPQAPRFGAKVEYGLTIPGLPETALEGKVLLLFPPWEGFHKHTFPFVLAFFYCLLWGGLQNFLSKKPDRPLVFWGFLFFHLSFAFLFTSKNVEWSYSFLFLLWLVLGAFVSRKSRKSRKNALLRRKS